MTENITFSIIIPTFNSANTINHCLNNLLTQSFGNFEILIIDNQSDDDTLKIVSNFNDKRIKVISEKDNGIYDAMNKGIKLAKGYWLYFMGADDKLFTKDILKNIWDIIKTSKSDIIFGNVIGEISGKKYDNHTLPEILSSGIHHQSIFLNKKIFYESPTYNLQFKVASDYHLMVQLFLKDCYKSQYVNLNVSIFGENGYSNQNYDYKYYSYHYILLEKLNGVKYLFNPKTTLYKSIHCCYYLASNKSYMLLAWRNIFHYVFITKELNFYNRLKIIYNMIYWSIKYN